MGKTSTYFKYAVGEIILVVIGILIALSINNWNSNRITTNRKTDYLIRISEELKKQIEDLNYAKDNVASEIENGKRILKILDTKNPDSIPALKQLLGNTATFWGITLSFPVTDEFINQNLQSQIKNDSLKLYLKYLSEFRDFSDIQNDYTKTQYTNTIEPFFVKNINYSEIAVDYYKDGLIQGGPKTDYNNLISSMELWNVATFKLETLNTGEYYLKSLNLLLEKLITQIEKEIDNP
ncbi:hypothetical protein SAMN04487989_101771 [Bizionia echini]|uniref:Uncharacterized protein n=1 Tax=Bizionia echini TaxID=649333 RepID=A0A1I4ZEG9_9FLAO|nr:DUF6090 family protein [Bizionia echini]SFN48671.1 hypothetical protein SAMN04487989_101771 [Bizionia echini]